MVAIDSQLVRDLVRDQFPQWAHLEVRAIEPGGWDNRSFRVGPELVARLPSALAYASQPEKEHHWLPRLAPVLAFAIPVPVAVGEPALGYPWRWSISRWISGETPAPTAQIARDLALFLRKLQSIERMDGPLAGAHNFHRGGDLRIYGDEVSRAIAILGEKVDGRAALEAWRAALATRWTDHPVWVHGDVSPGNLLARRGRLAAVIDFGNLAIGDPACDLAIAWSWLGDDAGRTFKSALDLDEGTWLRARAWALWKALIVAAGLTRTNAIEYADPRSVIDRCVRAN